ncbi:MAG: MnhB domain-containing protein [Candidatus Nezhaarchaeales archaeon]
MRIKDAIVGIMAAVFLFTLVATVMLGSTGWTPSEEVRPLAKFYLENSFNVFNKTWWAASREPVSAMIWDYRGLDTYYESSVFFLAVMGSLALFKIAGIKLGPNNRKKELGLSIIVKTVNRLTYPLIVIVSVAIATIIGGFQAGSIFAVAQLIIIASFSRYFLEGTLRLTRNRCLTIETTFLMMIVLVAGLPVLAGAIALMQNQAKPWSPLFSFPEAIGPVETSGSIFFYNIAEFLAVGAGFTLLFLLLSIPEEEFRRAFSREH